MGRLVQSSLDATFLQSRALYIGHTLPYALQYFSCREPSRSPRPRLKETSSNSYLPRSTGRNRRRAALAFTPPPREVLKPLPSAPGGWAAILYRYSARARACGGPTISRPNSVRPCFDSAPPTISSLWSSTPITSSTLQAPIPKCWRSPSPPVAHRRRERCSRRA